MANTVEIVINASDHASGPIKGVASSLGELETRGTASHGVMSTLGGVMGGVVTTGLVAVSGAALGVVAGIGGAVNTAMNFESAMSAVGAVAGASGTELAGLSQTALQLGMDTTLAGVSATDAATAMQELASGGVSVADIMGGAAYGALQLASAGGVDVATAAGIAALALKDFGLAGADLPHVADLFAAAANTSAVTVTDLGTSLQYVGPVAHTMGISIEELTGTLAELGDQGIKGSTAGTALRGMITNLAAPTKQQSAVMKELNLSFFDANGHMKNLAGISEELHTKLGGLTDQQRTAALSIMFGNEGLTAAQILYDGGAAAVEKYTASVNVAGAAAANGTLRNDNLKGSLAQLGSVWETLTIRVGTAFIPAVRGAVDGLADLLTRLMPLVTGALPGFIAGLTSAIGAAARFGAGVVSAGRAVLGAFEAFRTGQTTLAQFLGGMETFVRTLLDKLGELKDRALPHLQQFLAAIGTFLTGTALPVVAALGGQLAAALGGWVQGTAIPYLRSNLPAWLNALAGWISGTAAPAVASAITSVANALSGWITTTAIPYLHANLPQWIAALTGWITGTALPAITSAVSGLAAALVSWIRGGDAVAAFGGWQGAVVQALANVVGLLGEFGSIAGPKLTEWIKSEETQAKFGALLAAVGSGTADILNALNDFSTNAGVRAHQWLEESGPRWLVSWQALGEVTSQGITTVFGAMDRLEAEGVDKLTNWLNTAGPDWLHSWSALGDAMGTALGAMFSALGTWTAQMLGELNNFINTAGPAWLHSWDALGEAVSTALGNMVAGAVNWLGQLASTIIGALLSLVPQAGGAASGIGAAIIQGLTGSILAGAGQVASAAAGVVTNALNAAKNALGIKSPSREFAEVGENAVLGLVIGMDAKQAEAAAKAAQVASAVAKAATDVLGALRAVSAFDFAANSPTAGQLAGLTGGTTGIVGAMQAAAANFKAEGLKAAGDFADTAGKVGGAVKNAVEGLTLLGKTDWANASPTGSALSWFTLLTTSLVANFAVAGQQFAEGALKDASDFADAASKVGGSVKNALEGLQALASADWAKSSPSGSAMGWFTHLTASLVANFATAGAGFADGALKTAGDFADAASKVGGAVKNSLTGLQDLAAADWAKSSPNGSAMAWFTHLVASLVQNFATAATAFSTEALASAANFAESAGKVMGLVGPAVTGFKDLGTLVAPSQASMDQLVAGVKYLVGKFAEIAATMSSEGIAATGAFSTAAGTALGAAKTGVELFAAMAGDKDKAGNHVGIGIPSKQAIDTLVIAVKYVVLQFSYMAAELSGEGVKQMQAFATAAGTVLNTAKTGTDLFKSMEKLAVPSKEAIDFLLGSMRYVIQQTQAIASAVGGDGLAQAQAFATGTLAVFTAIKDTLEGFAKIKDYQDIPAKTLHGLFDALGGALTEVGHLVTRSGEIKKNALDYLSNMQAAFAAAQQASALGGNLGGGTPTPAPPSAPLPALAAGGIVTRPTVALIGEAGPEAVVPLNRYNGTGGGTTIVINVQGSVVTQGQLVDTVYQGLLAKQRNNSSLGFR